MDKTKEFIEMCEEAKEAQKYRTYAVRGVIMRFEDGDFIYHKKSKQIEIYCETSRWNDGDYCGAEHVWLPRQDQLQELYLKTDPILSSYGLMIEFTNWLWVVKDKIKRIASMEQLWLAFLYDQEYNKKWSDEMWVVEQ